MKGLAAKAITNWDYHYYRTKRGVEVDLMLTGNFGILPIEIKYGSKVTKCSLSNLTNFIVEHKLPFGIIINQAQEALWLTDKIYQIPVGWL